MCSSSRFAPACGGIACAAPCAGAAAAADGAAGAVGEAASACAAAGAGDEAAASGRAGSPPPPRPSRTCGRRFPSNRPASRQMMQQSTQVSPETPVFGLPGTCGGTLPGRGSVTGLGGAAGIVSSSPACAVCVRETDAGAAEAAASGPAGVVSVQETEEAAAAGVSAAEAFRRAEDFRLERDMIVFSFSGGGRLPGGRCPFF